MMVLLDPAAVEGLTAAVNGTMLVLAIAGTLATLGLLIWTLRSASSAQSRERPRLDRRKGSSSDRRDPREALALVGDALAATHNPRVLLPVILEVITESTGASGGQIIASGREVGWIGTVGGPMRRHFRYRSVTRPTGTRPFCSIRATTASRPRRRSSRSGSRRRLPLRSRTPASTPSSSIRQSRTT